MQKWHFAIQLRIAVLGAQLGGLRGATRNATAAGPKRVFIATAMYGALYLFFVCRFVLGFWGSGAPGQFWVSGAGLWGYGLVLATHALFMAFGGGVIVPPQRLIARADLEAVAGGLLGCGRGQARSDWCYAPPPCRGPYPDPGIWDTGKCALRSACDTNVYGGRELKG